MYKIAAFLLLIFSVSASFGQTYIISQVNGQTISTCSGNFYDSGGSAGAYVANESYTVTFSPGTAGGFVQINFTQWNLGVGDQMQIFDGPSTSSPSFGTFNSSLSPVGMVIGASILNSSGAITISWTSISSAPGWAASLSCGLPCQTFEADLASSIPAFHVDSGIYYIDVCLHDTIWLTAKGNYPYNDSTYHQSDTTCTYQWKFSNGTTDTNQTVMFVADTVKGYNVYLTMWDTNGCMSSIMPKIRIRVSTKPSFDGTRPLSTDICQYDTATLHGQMKAKKWKASAALNHAGTTYLPDGSGASYTSTLVFNQFAQGQSITSAANILGICATMEHSYLGDLNITITCPNGQSTTLKSYPGGTSTFLGEPIDNNAQPIPGVGYEYCWRPNGTTTMLNAAGSYSHTFTDALGTVYNNHSYLPPSTSYPANATAQGPYPIVNYLPQTSFNNLIGCPLNGAWTITVTDNLAIDNGYIFSWGIEFAQNVLPVSWSYTPAFATSSWNPNSWVIGGSGNDVLIQPADTGALTYNFTVVDSFGCSYDTSVVINVLKVPEVDLGSDTTICGSVILSLDAGNNAPGSTYLWSSGNNTQHQLVNSTGLYSVTVTSNNGNIQCSASDSVQVTQYPMANLDLGPDTCVSGTSMTLDAGNAGSTPPFQYLWSDNSTNQTLNVTQSGIYGVTVGADLNSPCLVSDSVRVILMPLNYLGEDAEICDFESYIFEINETSQDVVYTYNWILDGSPVGGNNNQLILSDLSVGKHNLILKIAGGCSDNVVLTVNNCKIEIPNIITPNGDGFNDNFKIKGLENFENTKVIIYNRWGKKVFESNNYQNGDWGGDVSDGVYFYILELSKGEHRKYQGTITVIKN